jgi:cation diffusion facilitator CzcD-associated flavoprotein CzcO
LHSAEYKTPDVLAGKRVLVIGAGNSGCDIAVEAAQHAAATFHSVRRGYHYLPKFLLGKPIDQCGERLLNWRFPLWLRRAITRVLVRLALGPAWRVGLQAPDHKLFETHPIINSQLYYYLGHGRISPKPDVAELLPGGVRFVDGSEEQLDVIIYATGFKISFPFIDAQHLNVQDGRPNLYLNVFHPTDHTLFVAGLIQPDSGQWGLVDLQARLIAQVLRLEGDDPAAYAQFCRQKCQPGPDLAAGISYINSTRHLLEVEHHSYRRRLEKMIVRLGGHEAVERLYSQGRDR